MFCFGKREEHWKFDTSRKGRYETIKDEATANKIYYILMAEFQNAFYKARYLLDDSPKIRGLKCSKQAAEYYHMKEGDPPSMEHVIALILYTDFDSLSYRFSQTFRKMTSTESREITQQREMEFWNWRKRLIEAVNAFGTEVTECNIAAYYHGISFIYFDSFVAEFNSPFSTTTKIQIAYQFAANDGLVLEVGQRTNTAGYGNSPVFFNCTFISCFGNEDERLFIQPIEKGHMDILSIRNMKTNENYGKYISAITFLQKITCSDFYGGFGMRSIQREIFEMKAPEIRISKEFESQLKVIMNVMKGKEKDLCPEYVRTVLNHWTNKTERLQVYMNTIKDINGKIEFYNDKKKMVRIDVLNEIFKSVLRIDLYEVECDDISFWNDIGDMLLNINKISFSNLTKITIERNVEGIIGGFKKYRSIIANCGWDLKEIKWCWRFLEISK